MKSTKITNILILSSLVFTLSACKSNSTTSKEKDKQIEINQSQEPKETTDKTNKATKQTQSEKTKENKKTVPVKPNITYKTSDGLYEASLMSSLNGKYDGMGSIYKVEINNDTLTVHGSLSYLKDPNTESIEILNNNTYNFKLTNKTIYQASGGQEDNKKMSKDEFIKYINELLDSGLGLNITLEKGLVSFLEITS